MKIIYTMISIFLLATLVCGCAKVKKIVPDKILINPFKSKDKTEETEQIKEATPSAEQLLDQYIKTARELEVKEELVKAVEQYKLALAVDNQNQYAIERINELKITCREFAEKHYAKGLAFYQKGEYSNAQNEFLNVLKYEPDHTQALKMLKKNKLSGQEEKGYMFHKIQKGETVSVMAKKYYGDPMKYRFIAEFNKMDDATRINVGQMIKIPVIDGIFFFKSPGERINFTGDKTESELTNIVNVKDVISHTVRPGESLSDLATLYYGDTDNFSLLARFNQLSEDSTLKVGQKIQIPEIAGTPFTIKGKELAKNKAAAQKNVEPVKKPETVEQAKEPETVKQETVKIQERPPTIEEQIAENRARGLKFFEAKKYEDAVNSFKKILDIKPDDSVSLEYISESHYQQGLKHFINNEYLAAIEEFKKSLQYNDKCEKCDEYINESKNTYLDDHYNLGLIHYKNQELEEAKKEWELIYSLDPEYEDVAIRLEKVNSLIKRLERIKRSSEDDN